MKVNVGFVGLKRKYDSEIGIVKPLHEEKKNRFRVDNRANAVHITGFLFGSILFALNGVKQTMPIY